MNTKYSYFENIAATRSHSSNRAYNLLTPLQDESPWGQAPPFGVHSHAERGAFLIDSYQYYSTLRKALPHAKKVVLMIGWEFHSDFILDFDHKSPNAHRSISQLLRDLCAAEPNLHIYILGWKANFAMSLLRQRDTKWKFERATNQIKFVEDNQFPLLGSLHQKIVIIDDKIAFSGGMDLSLKRWDNRNHNPDSAKQRTPNERQSYGPVHDVQLLLQGDVVGHLAGIIRERWQTVQNVSIPWTPQNETSDVKFNELCWNFYNMDLSVALTRPPSPYHSGIAQIKANYQYLIEHAQRFVYIENQYFSSEDICQALAVSLNKPSGPQIVLVLWNKYHGNMERAFLGSMRQKNLDTLTKADTHNRLRVYYLENGKEREIKIHSKLLIADNNFATIGSANLTNRSMGMDSECDITLWGFNSSHAKSAIQNFLSNLLSEHLQVNNKTILEAIAAKNQLHAIIDSHANPQSRFKPFPPAKPPNFYRRICAKITIIDLKQPISKTLRDVITLKKCISIILPILIASILAWLIYQRLQQIEPREIVTAFSRLSLENILKAFLFTFASYVSLTLYDYVGLRYLDARLSYSKAALTSFVSYAANFNFGALIGGVALRLGLYRGWNIGTGTVSKLIVFCGLTTWIGYLTIAGTLLSLYSTTLPEMYWVSNSTLQLIGIAMLLLVVCYLALSHYRITPIFFRKYKVRLPPLRLGIMQVVLSSFQWTMAASAVYSLFAVTGTISFSQIFLIYLIAAVAGLLAHIPAGLGVIEYTFILLLVNVPEASVVAGLLAFRGIYYIIPLILASIAYLYLQAWQLKFSRKDVAANKNSP